MSRAVHVHSVPSVSSFRKALTLFFKTPSILVITVAMVLGCSLLTPGQYLFDLNFPQRLALNAVFTIAFLSYTLLFLPTSLYFGLARNIPWFYVEILFYSPLAFILSLGVNLVLLQSADLAQLLWLFLVIMVNVGLAVALSLLALQRQIEIYFQTDRRPLPIWTPLRQNGDCQLQPFLDVSRKGDIWRIDAENQYVRVFTAGGETLLRMSLSEAEKRVPSGRGLRVHRSHWIAFDRISDLKFENGNPRIVDHGGESIPASRAKLSKIKEFLGA